MTDDSTLLRGYAATRSEADFTELVRRHVDLVYSAALRQVNGDAHLAQDVTSLVFTDLARKASTLVNHRLLPGWLFTSTRFAAAKLVRTARRRQAREAAALLMQDHSPTDAPLDWERVRPVLDEALGELDERDREAILLRYLGGCDYAAVGAKLALSENAARMRVDRALDKLRALLARRGATSTAAALSLALANQAVVAAPAGLAATVTGAALAGAGPVAALTFMSLTKLQLALAGAVLATGAGFYVVQERDNAALRAELAGLDGAHSSHAEIARLREANRKLAVVARRIATLEVSDAEFARLREQQEKLAARVAQPRPNPRPVSPGLSGSPAAETFDIKDIDQRPAPVLMTVPAYPTAMAVAGVEGNVVVSFTIDADGNVQNAHATRSTRSEFEAAAVDAVSKWQFKPGQKGGVPVNVTVSQLVAFEMSAAPPPVGTWF
ncbi:MAG: polymerase, sigma-24 subunit, subfamily [Lacunisphaera sp.]|nr:polymerase, sigma-24 subunit, subfamily [Lacunisphaera sp.]